MVSLLLYRGFYTLEADGIAVGFRFVGSGDFGALTADIARFEAWHTEPRKRTT
jgi:hypothetical protein